jgi:hypothetical protein
MNLWNNASPEALQNTYKILHYKNLVLPYRTRNYQYYLYDGKCFEWSVVDLKQSNVQIGHLNFKLLQREGFYATAQCLTCRIGSERIIYGAAN